MKITIDIGLEDLLEVVEDYDGENDEYHTYCTYKDTEQLKTDVKQMVLNEISNKTKKYLKRLSIKRLLKILRKD